MDPGEVAPPLGGPTQSEEMLTARGYSITCDYRQKGQREYGTHVVNLAQDVGERVSRLSRPVSALPILVMRRERADGI